MFLNHTLERAGVVLVLLVLFVLLSGCASMLPAVIVEAPPASLLQDCPHPEVATATNGDLAKGILDYREALSLCNNDKAALRGWQRSK